MNTEINNQCARLESLLHIRPTEALRDEVESALRSKWEGVQVWAGRVLAAWGGRRSIDALRRWLEASLPKDAGWAVRGEAIRSLCVCYQPRDIQWLMDLYFGAEDRLLRHEFSPLIIQLPEPAVRERIALERRSEIASRREAATAALRTLESWKHLGGQRSNMALQPTSRGKRKVKSPGRSRAARD